MKDFFTVDNNQAFNALSADEKRAFIKRVSQKPTPKPRSVAGVVNPTRTQLLDLFGLNKTFVSGTGSTMRDVEGREYIDFLSQYGALPFGHNPSHIWDVLRTFEREFAPSMVQPFVPQDASRLAQRLAQLTPSGLEICTFANSGAEVVESAIKLARVRTKRPVIISTKNGFHGKTLGALSATGRPQYQKPFGLPLPDFEHLPYGDIDALGHRLRREDVAAFIVEPIQGEGGIIPAPPGYIAEAIELCKGHGTLSVVDEIQTGLGRTGSLFALPSAAPAPNMLLLAKALGGGLFPIGVCIVTRDAWDEQFGRLHSSTFAGSNLGCRIALAVLDRLTENDQRLVRDVAMKGRHLLSSLRGLQQQYPDVIKDVRGRGLMVGVEFHSYSDDTDSGLLSYCSLNESLVALLSSYLVNDHGLISAPMFNSSHVLRLQPALTINRSQIDRALEGIAAVCDALQRKDTRELVHHLICDKGAPALAKGHFGTKSRMQPTDDDSVGTDRRFAFLLHYLKDDDYRRTEPSMMSLSEVEMLRWQAWCRRAGPGVCRHIRRVTSPTGQRVQGDLIILPMLPRDLLRMGKDDAAALLNAAITQAQDCGATHVGLGGFTSILSQGGQTLLRSGVNITSGNTLTAITAVQGVEDVAGRVGLDLAAAHVAVVGATGAIGRLVSLLMSRKVRRITLIGNPDSLDFSSRAQAIMSEIREERIKRGQLDAPVLNASTDLRPSLRDADVVLVATSADYTLVRVEDLKAGSIVGDISRPPNVPFETIERRDIFVFEAALVELPEAVEMGPVTGLRPGLCWGCLAETILLTLAGEAGNVVGKDLSLDYAERLTGLARKHHFQLAPPHWYGSPLDESYFERARRHEPASPGPIAKSV